MTLALDDVYYNGHPVDLTWAFTYTMLVFAIHIRYKISNLPTSEKHAMFFSENVKFETISKFGIPLTVAIVCMVILITLVDVVFVQADELLSTQSVMLGVVAMLGFF